jgi:hypothetical protein
MEAIPKFEPYAILPDGSARSFCRGIDKTEGHDSERFDSLSDYWVSIITGKFDQDVSAMWVGPKGSGKSSAVLSVSYHCAVKLAAWANDGSKWDEYYNLHELTACILEEEATRLMNVQRKYVVKNYDDIGLGWNARSWQDEENVEKNDIFQINRTDNSIQNMSVPNQFLLDKVPRSLVSHYIEMDQKLYELGFTTIKLFKPKTMFREAKIFNPFLMVNRNKFVNYLIPSPPHDLWMEYKKLRNKNSDIARRRRKDAKEKREEIKKLKQEQEVAKLLKQQEKNTTNTANPKMSRAAEAHKKWEEMFTMFTQEFIQMKQETDKPMDKIIALVARRHGHVDGNAIAYWRRMELIKKYNLDKISSA